jgi:hypothetical protein
MPNGGVRTADAYLTKLGTSGALVAAGLALVVLVMLVMFDVWPRVAGFLEDGAGLFEQDADGVESVRASDLADPLSATLGPTAGLGTIPAAGPRGRSSGGVRPGGARPGPGSGTPSGGNPNHTPDTPNNTFGNTPANTVGNTVNNVGNTVNNVGDTVNKPVSGVGNTVNNVGDTVDKPISGVGDTVNNVGDTVDKPISGVGDTVKGLGG